MVINVRSVFHEGSKYYPQVILDKLLHKLAKKQLQQNILIV